jgi:hypothetical protein
MAIDGSKSNLSPESADYIKRLEAKLVSIQKSLNVALSSVQFLKNKTSGYISKMKPGVDGVPYAQSSGTVTLPSTLANGVSANVTVVFPTGRFSQTPIITIGTNSVRITAQADARSADGFRFLVNNFSGATAGPGSGDTTLLGFWTATQMTEDSSSG